MCLALAGPLCGERFGPGASRLARDLERSVELDDAPGWKAPVLLATATEGSGVEDVADAATRHATWCASEGLTEWTSRRGDAQVRLYLDLIAERARRAASVALSEQDSRSLRDGTVSPHELVERMK